MVAARFEGENGTVVGAYSPYFWVESDRAMAGGREFRGQPKRIASVRVETIGDLHVGRVIHNGFEIFTGSLQYKARTELLGQGAEPGRPDHQSESQDRSPHRQHAGNQADNSARPDWRAS